VQTARAYTRAVPNDQVLPGSSSPGNGLSGRLLKRKQSVVARLDDMVHAGVGLARFDKLALALAKARVSDRSTVSHQEVFGSLEDFQWLWFNTIGYRRLGFVRDLLPALPDSQTQAAFVGRSDDAAIRDGFNIYRTFKSLASRHGRPLLPASSVLDFGCGWGRILRLFLRDVAPGNLHGVDVMPLALELCRNTNPWANFSAVSVLPPADLPSDTFDLVYLYSVFSHLSEDAHEKWLTEFRRVLKPGGLLMASTRPREYIVSCDTSRKRGFGVHTAAMRAFVGKDEWLARYDRGEFCHSAVGDGGGSLNETFFGETCIPEAYVRRRWTDRFDFREYVPHGARLHQDIIVVQKPLG
jgi:SAM-dependent methyltransferase